MSVLRIDQGRHRPVGGAWPWGFVLAIGIIGCSVGESAEGLTSLGFPGSGPAGGSEGATGEGTTEDDSGDDDDDDDDDSVGDDDDSVGDDDDDDDDDDDGGTTGGGMSTFNPIDDSGDDDGGGGGQQPDSGMWSSCDNAGSCGGGLACLGTDDMAQGVCTVECSPAGNPAGCAPSPGGTAETTCLSVGVNSICALDCSGDKACPGGMRCIADSDDAGPIEICL